MRINTIYNIIRYILAACFILSGLLKAIAIDAFEQEVQMYGDSYIGGWVHDYSSEIAFAVCAVEITVGIVTLWRRMAIFTGIIFFGMLLFFVYLTAVNLFFPTIMGSIETCGCFGELIHFTPISAFVKSTVLLLLASVNICLAVKVKRRYEDVLSFKLNRFNSD
ncbi:MAG: hypothetical protein Q4F85_08430 [Prevotella sp.]|nr:hypothetical protein [Prevotella sp.]